ncbi:MAG: anthranilate synthase component I family protein [Nitrospiraceae bacterium]|nr:MAG: anthranilate synthase component I family protein [Nitrospiraceae bacterium]
MLTILPSKKHFTENAQSGRICPLRAEFPFAPPQQVYEKLESPLSFLLESIRGPEKTARYSFCGSSPLLEIRVKNGLTDISGRGNAAVSLLSPLKQLREVVGRYRLAPDMTLPPFIGGAVGMMSYDFVHYFERLPRTAVDDIHIPDAHFMIFDTVAAFDHKEHRSYLFSCPGVSEALAGEVAQAHDWGQLYDRACEKIAGMYNRVMCCSPEGPRERTVPGRAVRIRHEMGKQAYMEIVRKAKEYIRAGDIFQANLSQRVSAVIGDVSPWQVYQVLSTVNPSPFGGYLNMGEYCIASSSPERLVRVSGSRVETRPIAGTRPRGVNAEGDRLMEADLLLNEKERAEHLMLIDLERNDLGKISDYGTVIVDELMITEAYSHVIHIVSNVTGALADGKDCFDAIRATFPGGTITGVPKVRCMEIIDELEPVARGPYTGSMGYIGFTGDMDMNIIIRTFLIKDRTAYVQAGAGIVADSDPEKEYYETLKKAEALIKTLEML